jgi:hypothetical protein
VIGKPLANDLRSLNGGAVLARDPRHSTARPAPQARVGPTLGRQVSPETRCARG